MIDGGKLKIHPTNMEAILKCLVPTNVTKFRRVFGESQCIWKFMESFLVVVAPLHVIKKCGERMNRILTKWRHMQVVILLEWY
jgi:hypothetical protein